MDLPLTMLKLLCIATSLSAAHAGWRANYYAEEEQGNPPAAPEVLPESEPPIGDSTGAAWGQWGEHQTTGPEAAECAAP